MAFDDAKDPVGQDALYQASLYLFRRQREPEVISHEMELFRLYQSNELVLLEAPDADALVVIGVPPQQCDQSENAYAAVERHFARPHKIHSENLIKLGSAKFTELLGATSQFRTERRLRNEGFLPGGKPSGIKYLLDLRPPTEDDEASFLLTDLSCSGGVLTWFKAQEKYGIPQTIVCGQDDSSLLPIPTSDSSIARKQPKARKKKSPPVADTGLSTSDSQAKSRPDQSKEPQQSRISNWEGVFPKAPVPDDEAVFIKFPSDDNGNVSSGQESPRTSPNAATNAATTQGPEIQRDYSQLRHYSAIERLLHAIEGQDPILDSAPKMWTFFATAKYFDCASDERISGWITKWLFTAPNHYFIQCNPEVCYRIGLGIQSEALLKDAFSLLVGEKALMNVYRKNEHYSVAGRKLECLDDDELNRIDHATNVFMRRIQATYEALIGEDMLWLERSKVFGVLASFNAQSLREKHVVQELKECVKMFVRARVMWVLTRDYNGDWPEMEQVPESVRPFYPHAAPQSSTYAKLSEEERLFTRFFWMALKEERFDVGDRAIFTPLGKAGGAHGEVSPAVGWSKLAVKLRPKFSGDKLFEVQREDLHEWEASFVKILRGRARAKAEIIRDWSDDEAEDVEIYAKSSDGNTCSGMHQGLGELVSDPQAETSTLEQLNSLQLSSPKRSHATHSATDPGDRKRPRLNADDTSDESDQPSSKTSDLPIRGVKPAPVEKRETVEVSRMQEPSRMKRAQRQMLAVPCETDFSIHEMLVELSNAVHGLCDEVLIAPHFFRDDEVPPTSLIDTLMCLTDAEWKYLPLWAGGNDDGSGGVFEDGEVPNLETGGFAGGKRGLSHEGNSFIDSSDWSEVVSTVAKASKEATDGTATGTATVQSFGDVDMDVQSLDDESIAHDTETMVGLNTSLVDNLGGEMKAEELKDDEEDVEDEGAELEEYEEEDGEEADWDDCGI